MDRYFHIRLSNLEVVKTNMTQVLKHFLYLEKTGASVKRINQKLSENALIQSNIVRI
jgi:hypothetical protein